MIRPIVRRLHPYVPGEQPKIKGLIKLNTNENPYPPSPGVMKAIKAAADGRLRLYPNPTAQLLREKLAEYHRCQPENVVVGNGSDELLALATRAFVEPVSGPAPSGSRAGETPDQSRSTVQFFTPSYSLYPILADIHGARANAVPLAEDYGLPTIRQLSRDHAWDFRAALTFVTSPNAPSGRGYSTEELEGLCQRQRGVVVLDEAYVDFATNHAMELALRHPNVLVARTFSKAYSLCFLRVGYFVGPPDLIEAIDKIRDSYNVNGLGQIAALAALNDLPYYRKNFQRVVATRQRLSTRLAEMGFEVLPSRTNFILVRPPRFPAEEWLDKLRVKKVLVRWFRLPAVKDYLRISIGTDAEADILLRAVEIALAPGGRRGTR